MLSRIFVCHSLIMQEMSQTGDDLIFKRRAASPSPCRHRLQYVLFYRCIQYSPVVSLNARPRANGPPVRCCSLEHSTKSFMSRPANKIVILFARCTRGWCDDRGAGAAPSCNSTHSSDGPYALSIGREGALIVMVAANTDHRTRILNIHRFGTLSACLNAFMTSLLGSFYTGSVSNQWRFNFGPPYGCCRREMFQIRWIDFTDDLFIHGCCTHRRAERMWGVGGG